MRVESKGNGGEVRPRNEAREDLMLDPALPKSPKSVLNGYFKHRLLSVVLFSRDKLMPKS